MTSQWRLTCDLCLILQEQRLFALVPVSLGGVGLRVKGHGRPVLRQLGDERHRRRHLARPLQHFVLFGNLGNRGDDDGGTGGVCVISILK